MFWHVALGLVTALPLVGQDIGSRTALQRIEEAQSHVERAESLSENGRWRAAIMSIREARRSLESARAAIIGRQALGRAEAGLPVSVSKGMERLLRNHDSLKNNRLSVIRARVMSINPHWSELEDDSEWVRAVMKLGARIAPGEDAELMILGVGKNGMRRRLTQWVKRSDLHVGKSINVFHGPYLPNGLLKTGKEFWFVIGPPQSPHVVGKIAGVGPSELLFAEAVK